MSMIRYWRGLLRSTPLVGFSGTMVPIRSFSFTTQMLAKQKKGKKTVDLDPEDASPLTLDFDLIGKQYENVLEKFNKISMEVKRGKSSANLFDKLKINVDGEPTIFTQVAQTTLKNGRTFMITVFDPKDTQGVINSILDLGLNLNPVRDSSNTQTLKVPCPPVTAESRKETAKVLKEAFEEIKNGKKDSLAKIRADIKQDIQKQTKKKKLTDAEKLLEKELEEMHKKFTTKLTEAFKAAEKVVLK